MRTPFWGAGSLSIRHSKFEPIHECLLCSADPGRWATVAIGGDPMGFGGGGGTSSSGDGSRTARMLPRRERRPAGDGWPLLLPDLGSM